MTVFQANLDSMDFKPITAEDLEVELLEGEPDFRIHVLRETADATGTVWAGVAKVRPCKIRYEFQANDTVYVLAGEATVVDEATGARIEMRTGDMLSFPKGMAVTWTFESEFIELFASTGV